MGDKYREFPGIPHEVTAREIHRNAIASDDSGNPALGSGIDCSDYSHLLVEVVIGGTASPQWDVTPLFGNSVGSVYQEGVKRTVASNERFVIAVDGSADVYFKVDGSSGTNPTITIYVMKLKRF